MGVEFIQKQIESLDSLNTEIQTAFQNGDSNEIIEQLIEKYKIQNEDANLISFQSNLLVQKGDYDQAKSVLEKSLKKYPFHFDINLNLGIVYEIKSMLPSSLYQYVRTLKYASADSKDLAKTYVDRMLSLIGEAYQGKKSEHSDILKEAKRIIAEHDERFFPIDTNQKSVVRKVMHQGTKDEYMTNLYKSIFLSNVDENSRFFQTTETFKGHLVVRKDSLILEPDSLIPVTLLEQDTQLKFKFNDQKHFFNGEDLSPMRYHYLNFKEGGALNIDVNKPVFIGKPILLKDPPKKKRLIFNIFVDGLSFDFLDRHNFEAAMPYTYEYFRQGKIASNCYATSEWTFPSVATMMTGKYTTNHGVFHPEFIHPFAENNKMVQESFKEAGYFTALFSGDWRVTPAHGYHKGFDRILYRNYSGGFDCKEVISEALEHLGTFKDKNNFMWITLGDVHLVPDEVDLNLMSQSKIDISERVNSGKKGVTTVLSSYDERKLSKYLAEIKRVDFFLNMLYRYFEEHYNEDEILIVLQSDHGQSFLEDHPFLLNESRRKVPLMVRGGGIEKGETSEFIELTDLLPILLHHSGLSLSPYIDGQLPKAFGGETERSFAFTESLHPNQTYKAAITDSDHFYYFESKHPVLNDGLIDLNGYSAKLINKQSGEEESEKYDEKMEKYEIFIWKHVKEKVKLS
ncbi:MULTISPECIES: sulfatase-like hydrolase/transferase [Saccharibacillus]|uniref:sulfatase-like hydrolase/transferase n=1 Tax=Saccharibacillus TaxID=456492 RepID=UPI00123C6652|nr:sulfatase-like hydrolase/transferase [Saccharibacillus sp. WB 17]MWJ33314.1 sulfatase-like hydrolase/transferase [Saccharibacillus sp. WB 17]